MINQQQFKQFLPFLILMAGYNITSKSPDYIGEKLSQAISSPIDGSFRMLDGQNTQLLMSYLRQWSLLSASPPIYTEEEMDELLVQAGELSETALETKRKLRDLHREMTNKVNHIETEQK